MGDKIHTPWTDDQVRSLNEYQASGVMHPFTCQCRANLIAQLEGWICPNGCPWDQKWCWEWMADWRWASDAFHGLTPSTSPEWRRIIYGDTSPYAMRRGQEYQLQSEKDKGISHNTESEMTNTLYIGLAIADNMFPPNCKIIRQNLTLDEVKSKLAGGNYQSRISSSDRPTLNALKARCGLEIQAQDSTPNINMREGDSILCMSVRGLPRLEGRMQYSEEEISNCEFSYGLWTVQNTGPNTSV